VNRQELHRAKEFYRGQLLMSLEDTMDHMLWMGEQAITVGRLSKPQDVLRDLDRVTREQMQQVARHLFTARRTHLAAVGPVPEEQADALRVLCHL
jgi:predicted Zn-dependent peptidase